MAWENLSQTSNSSGGQQQTQGQQQTPQTTGWSGGFAPIQQNYQTHATTGSPFTGSPTQYGLGNSANLKNMTDYLADIFMQQAQNSNWGIQGQQTAWNQMQSAMQDYISKYNAQQDQLTHLNSQVDRGYNDLQNQFGDMQGAYGQMQGAYGSLEEALRNIQNGVVPQETQDMLQQRYDMGMAQTTNALNDQYARQQADLLDNLGARGILNSTTSQGSLTGLGTNMLKALQDASQTYGIEQINALLEEPYKQFAATQGLHDAAGQNFNASSNKFGQANNQFQSLLSGLGAQFQMGQSSLDNLAQLFGMQGSAASIPSNVYNQTTDAAQSLWQALLAAETARLTSAQGQQSGSNNDGLWGAIGSIIGGLF